MSYSIEDAPEWMGWDKILNVEPTHHTEIMHLARKFERARRASRSKVCLLPGCDGRVRTPAQKRGQMCKDHLHHYNYCQCTSCQRSRRVDAYKYNL